MPAFGDGMCPKLVREVGSETRSVRSRALGDLCAEFKDPMSVWGCVECGVVAVLNAQASGDPDGLCRRRAAEALKLAARDARGRAALLKEGTPAALKPALEDEDSAVRREAYECLDRIAEGTVAGARALVAAGFPRALVGKAAGEAVGLQPLALGVLARCLADEQGLGDALDQGAVPTCTTLLGSFDAKTRDAAAAAMAQMCFAEAAKEAAIAEGAVDLLAKLLDDDDAGVRASACAALAAVTTTDEGKRRMVPPPEETGDSPAIDRLVSLLDEKSARLKTDALKCIANCAVHPRAREQMRESEVCLELLMALEDNGDFLLAKHATIAKEAVLWEP